MQLLDPEMVKVKLQFYQDLTGAHIVKLLGTTDFHVVKFGFHQKYRGSRGI